MRKIIPVLLIATLAATSTFAQNKENAVGVRLGTFSGITFKHYFDKSQALDAILTFGGNTVGFVGYYEIHKPFPDVPLLSWYYGGGGHLVFINSTRHYWNDSDDVAIGIDGVVGLSYTFEEIPLNLSIDLGPSINLADSPGVGLQAGISARYIF